MKEYIDLSQYGNDTKNRKYYTVVESFCHPAKMSWALTCWIIDNYCDPKKPEVVLDPMAGVGSTLVVGMMRWPQSVWLGVEFEDKFVKMCQANIRKVEKIAEEDMFMEAGQAICIQGDSRSLEGVVGKIISSPPFGRQVHKTNYLGRQKKESGVEYSDNPDNLGNLPHGKINKIISSPPYHGEAVDNRKTLNDTIRSLSSMGQVASEKYGDNNISNLKYGQVNKIIPSPPHEEGIGYGGKRTKKVGRGKGIWTQGVGSYSQDKDNIGEARGKTYLSEMLRVYRECWKVLVPGGLCILVLKDFIRKGERIPLGEHTIKLCEKAGFTHIRTHYRKIGNLSFWRILQVQKYGEKYRIDHENILVFRK